MKFNATHPHDFNGVISNIHLKDFSGVMQRQAFSGEVQPFRRTPRPSLPLLCKTMAVVWGSFC
jgi:hypothetical protein